MHITENTTLKEIYSMPQLEKANLYLIGKGETLFQEKENMTLKDLNIVQPTWYARDMAYGLNRLVQIAEWKEPYLYQVYSDEEIKKEPDKKDVQLFHFPGSQKGAFIILLAGGAYGCVCSLVEAFPVAAKLNELGYTAFCLNYRTAQPGLLPKPIDDLAASIRFITKNADEFCVNSNEYIVGGFSAGGHTAAVWGTKEMGYRKYRLPAPEMLMLGYPLITTERMSLTMQKEVVDLVLLGMFGENHSYDTRNKYNVDKHVDKYYPPVYIVQSRDDDTVPINNSECFIESLRKARIKFISEQPMLGGHGFGLGTATEINGWVERAIEFWKSEKEQL